MKKKIISIIQGQENDLNMKSKDVLFEKGYIHNYRRYHKNKLADQQSQESDGEVTDEDEIEIFRHTVKKYHFRYQDKLAGEYPHYIVHDKTLKFLVDNFDEFQMSKIEGVGCLDFNHDVFTWLLKWLVKCEGKIVNVVPVRKDGKLNLKKIEKFGRGGEVDDDDDDEDSDDDTFLQDVENPALMCVLFGNDTVPYRVNIAAVVKKRKMLYVGDWDDDNDLSILRRVLFQLNVKDCLVEKFAMRKLKEKVDNILFDANVHMSSASRYLKQKSLLDDCKRDLVVLLKKNSVEEGWLSYEHSTLERKALAVAIKYLNLTFEKSNHEFFKLERYKPSSFLKIDSTAMKCLRIFPNHNDIYEESGKYSSLFDVLNECSTKMGVAKLSNWLRQPLCDEKIINERLDVVNAFLDDVQFRVNVRRILRNIPDLHVISKRIQRLKASLKDLIVLREFVSNALQDIDVEILDYSGPFKKLIRKKYGVLKVKLHELDTYSTFIERFIDFKEYTENPNSRRLVIAIWDEQLKKIQRKLFRKEKKFFKKIEEVKAANHLEGGKGTGISCMAKKYQGEAMIYIKSSKPEIITRQLLMMKQNRELRIRHSTRCEIYFTTKEVETLSFELEQIEEMYDEKTANLKKKGVATANTFIDLFDETAEILSEIDVLSTFAQVASDNNYVRPTVLNRENNKIEIVDGRHPVVEKSFELFNGLSDEFETQSFIPNSVVMKKEEVDDDDDEKKSPPRFIVVTGPNMGGKSVYIIQIGLIVILSQIGSYVPATSATISVRDGIFTRIGASDSLHRGVSTFLGEMQESAFILNQATKYSLVIIDELGRGTSANVGFGLALAISHELIKKNLSLVLFATHFHELQVLATTYPCVVSNKHASYVSDEDSKIILNYKIKDGISGDSFGLDVANSVSFPEEIIRKAKRKILDTVDEDDDGDDDDEERDAKRRKISNFNQNGDLGDDENVIIDKRNETFNKIVKPFANYRSYEYDQDQTEQVDWDEMVDRIRRSMQRSCETNDDNPFGDKIKKELKRILKYNKKNPKKKKKTEKKKKE